MARSKGGMQGRGGKVPLNPKYTFAEKEEVENRDHTTFQPEPTRFSQIGPGDSRGLNANEPVRRKVSGSNPFKFDDGGV